MDEVQALVVPNLEMESVSGVGNIGTYRIEEAKRAKATSQIRLKR